MFTTNLEETIDTHLHAYGERDPVLRDELLRQAWAKEGRLIDPPLTGTGLPGISEMAAAVQSHYPGHTFRRTSGIDAHHSFARYHWELVDQVGRTTLSGLDIAEVGDDGLIRLVVGFLGPIPAKDAEQL